MVNNAFNHRTNNEEGCTIISAGGGITNTLPRSAATSPFHCDIQFIRKGDDLH